LAAGGGRAGLAVAAAAFCLVCNTLDVNAGFFLAMSTVESSDDSTLGRFEVCSLNNQSNYETLTARQQH